jgi:hypothetical protein
MLVLNLYLLTSLPFDTGISVVTGAVPIVVVSVVIEDLILLPVN